MLRHYFHKKDILLILTLIICTLIIFGINIRRSFHKGNLAKVTVNGKIFGEYSLEKDETITIYDSKKHRIGLLEIKDHKIRMKDADCPDHLCVKMGSISSKDATIICLPNEIMVEIIGDSDPKYDSIVN